MVGRVSTLNRDRGFAVTLAGVYLVATAAFTLGMYLPLMLDSMHERTFLPEALYVWIVLFFVPYMLVERAFNLWRGRAEPPVLEA